VKAHIPILVVTVATFVVACASLSSATSGDAQAVELEGCYQIRWTDENAGTWDAPLPDRIRLSGIPAQSERDQVDYEAALRYLHLANTGGTDEATLFSIRPTWRPVGVDSLEVDLSGGRSLKSYRYVLRAGHDGPLIVGFMGMRSSRGFAPLVGFEGRRVDCAADSLASS
jgi:hypothetical protein